MLFASLRRFVQVDEANVIRDWNQDSAGALDRCYNPIGVARPLDGQVDTVLLRRTYRDPRATILATNSAAIAILDDHEAVLHRGCGYSPVPNRRRRRGENREAQSARPPHTGMPSD